MVGCPGDACVPVYCACQHASHAHAAAPTSITCINGSPTSRFSSTQPSWHTSSVAATAVFPKEAEWPQLDVLLPRLVFCGVQSLQIVFGLYKLNNMGLLPVYPSDWISSMKVRTWICTQM